VHEVEGMRHPHLQQIQALMSFEGKYQELGNIL